MSDLKQQLQDYVEANVERVDVDDLRAVVAQPGISLSPRRPLRPVWAFALGALFVVAIGGVTWLLSANEAGLDDAVTQPDTPVVADEWNPILSNTKAGQAPPPATCPPGSHPNTPGPADQQRPRGATYSNQAGVFDQHWGRIIYIDEDSETWTFDVCTNTWEPANPTFIPGGSSHWQRIPELVYDVDSDRTIAFTNDFVAVYDANTNTWTQRSKPFEYEISVGAVYDPVSGLVVVQTGSGLVSYDVEEDRWTSFGGFSDAEFPPFMIGQISDTDLLAFLPFDGAPFQGDGLLVDSRTGEFTPLEPPVGGVRGGFGRLVYATSTDTPHVLGDDICQLDPATLDWTCISLYGGPASFGTGLIGAIVGDPINQRVVLIYGYGPGFSGQRFYDVNDIWAIDFDTGEWTQLLTRTGEMTYEQED